MHNDSMGPNNVDAMRAGLMQARNVSSQRVDDTDPNTTEQQSESIFNNIPIGNVPLFPGRFVPPNMKPLGPYSNEPQIENFDALIQGILSLSAYITGIKLDYDPSLDESVAQNILISETNILYLSIQTPYLTHITKQLTAFIYQELTTLPSLLNTYTRMMNARFESSTAYFNIGRFLNQGKMNPLIGANKNNTPKHPNNTTTNEHGSGKRNQEVLSNEQLTNTVVEIATALNSLREEVRNLSFKFSPIGSPRLMGGHVTNSMPTSGPYR